MARPRKHDNEHKKATAEIQRRVGDDFASEGFIDHAIERYEQAIDLDGRNVEARLGLADSYFVANMPKKAYRAYRKVLKSSPKNPECHFCLGEFFFYMGRVRAAIRAMKRSVKYDPDRAYYAYRLGEVQKLMGRRCEAETSLKQAVEVVPDDPLYQYKLGELYFQWGKIPEAIHHYSLSCEQAPVDDFYHIRLACALVYDENHERALRVFRRVVAIEPDNSAYRFLLAEQLYFMGCEQRAAEQLLRAGRLDAYDRDYVRRAHKRCGRHSAPHKHPSLPD